MVERILLLGTTGVRKSDVIANLQKYAQSQPIGASFISTDFEKDYLAPVLEEENLELHSYLDADSYRQRALWMQAWQIFERDAVSYANQNILLCLHGVLTRSSSGTRSPVDIPSLVKFAPTKIIVLIDDVYLKWSRTEERASGVGYRGRPTLEQLIDARRSEIFLGKLIANHISPKPRFFVLSVHHPARTLFRLVFGGSSIRPIYLSFPITDPRVRLRDGDSSGVAEVNEFLKAANEFELRNPKAVCFCPLTIDEFPLIHALKEHQDRGDQSETLKFPLSSRWDVRDFWEEEALLCDWGKIPKQIVLNLSDVKAVVGMITADVALRDYQLVRQSKRLAVFNPWSSGKEQLGVRNEIKLAIHEEIPCEIFQDPKHDNNGIAQRDLERQAGSLGKDVNSQLFHFNSNIHELFSQLSF